MPRQASDKPRPPPPRSRDAPSARYLPEMAEAQPTSQLPPGTGPDLAGARRSLADPRPDSLADPRPYLTGRWSVARDLRDGAEHGSYEGVAEFAPDETGTGLIWDEDGEIAFGPLTGRAQRRLLVVPVGEGWEVRFSDGRPFHPLDLTAPSTTPVRHDCGNDLYLGTFDILAADAFDVTWTVTGPRKDQRIHSRYRRIGG